MASTPASIASIPIGELAQRTGCNIETIRYYERVGVLPMAGRKGRFRRYGPEDVRRLAFVRRARELGFALEEVRTLLALAVGSEVACVKARRLAAGHLAEVRAKIADLRAMGRALAHVVQRCDAGEASGCPLIDALSSPSGIDLTVRRR